MISRERHVEGRAGLRTRPDQTIEVEPGGGELSAGRAVYSRRALTTSPWITWGTATM